ncbi:MAG: hypothetical protein ACM31O_21005 [Bacteroidota bacterium]
MAKMHTLRQIPAHEQFSPKNEFLGGRKVRATFSIRRSQDEPRYEKSIVFDFSGLSEEQLLELALYSVKVKAQAMLRALEPAKMLNPDSLSTIDVLKDIVEAPAKSGDPISAAVRSMMKAVGCDEATAREMVAVAQAKAEARRQEGKAKSKIAA